MADTTYNVRVKYVLDRDQAEAGANSLARTFDRLALAATSAFAAHRVMDFGRRLVNLQSQAESMRVALASLMVGFGAPGFTGGAKDFQKALAASQILMQQIYQDAAKLPGTAEDLMDAMRGAMPGGVATGHAVMGSNSVLDMAKKLVTGAWLLQIPGGVQTASREFQAMMEGRAQTRNDLFARLRGLMGDKGESMTAKQLNAMSEPQRWATINKALDKLVGPATETYARTWRAISTTTQNWAQIVLRTLTSGAFDTLKNKLFELNTWFVKNRQEIEATARALGTDLGSKFGDAMDRLKDAVSFVVSNRTVLIEIAKAFLAVGAASKLAGGKLTGAGGVGMGLAVNALTGGEGAMPAILSGVAGLLITFGGAVAAAATAVLALQAAVNLTTTAIEEQQKMNMTRDTESKRLMGLYKRYEAMDSGGINDPLAVDGSLYALGKQIIQEQKLMKDPRSGELEGRRFARYAAGNLNLDDDGIDAARLFLKRVAVKMKNDPDVNGFGPREATADEKLKALLTTGDTRRGTPRKSDVNVVVNIKQDISQAEDPDRILVRTKKALEDALIRPIESGNNRFSVLR